MTNLQLTSYSMMKGWKFFLLRPETKQECSLSLFSTQCGIKSSSHRNETRIKRHPNCRQYGTIYKKPYTLATWCKELTPWKRPWSWEGLGAGGEGDNRGWDGWMASPTQWTWVWVNSGSWWWTGRPGVLQFMGLQSRTWLNDWTELKDPSHTHTHTKLKPIS